MKKLPILFLIILCAYFPISAQKISRLGEYSGYETERYKGFTYSSHYIKINDRIYLATDVYLPKKLSSTKNIPTILYATRYVRSLRLKFPLSIFKDPVLADVSEEELRFFTSHGYACVIVDMRGSGASTGVRKMEFGQEEVNDARSIINWIKKQKWSNGIIGTTGVSYVGTMAEMILANQLPEIKACISRSNIFDLFGYILFPGGVKQSPFIDVWKNLTNQMDHNDFGFAGKNAKFIKGVHYVKKQKGIFLKALKDHKNNFDIQEGLKGLTFRDDSLLGIKLPLKNFSLYNYCGQIEASKTPIFRISGWYDGALSKSCIDGYYNTTNTKRVLIGPWDHGPTGNVSPYSTTTQVHFPIFTEMLRFFDHYLKGIDNGIDTEPIINYFTVGEEKWKTSDVWLPTNTHVEKYFFTNDHLLEKSLKDTFKKEIIYSIDYSATSGSTSRWNSIVTTYMNGPTFYKDRTAEDKKLLCFTTQPFQDSVIVTGHPIINLTISVPANSIHLFCYLEDISPDGTTTYITEGFFNPLHNKIDSSSSVYKTCYPVHSLKKDAAFNITPNKSFNVLFDLLPISYQIAKGHKIRIAIAGADKFHFDEPLDKPGNLTISTVVSYIELPITHSDQMIHE